VKESYFEAIRLIERLHRQFLEVIKVELDRTGVVDTNNIQALTLSNIGKEELTVGELTNRGYYLGSNVSYNVKKMVENGYLEQKRSPHDRRSARTPYDTACRQSAGGGIESRQCISRVARAILGGRPAIRRPSGSGGKSRLRLNPVTD
jgi:hypothetical protein